MRHTFRQVFRVVTLLAVTLGAWGQSAQNPPAPPANRPDLQSTDDWNRRLQELARLETGAAQPGTEYRLGAQDLLEISVFDAPELNRSVRVAAGGEISLPLIGAVKAAGLTPRELELVLQELLRRTYMKEPHVSVFVKEMESHSVSVVGAVKKPGVFQIRGTKTVLEMLSMAEGLADDAGDTLLLTRGPSSKEAPVDPTGETSVAGKATEEDQAGRTVEINLKRLLESGDAGLNAEVHASDVIKVTRAGVVYVVGAVNRAGGFVMKNNESITVLQAIALSEGLTRYAKKGAARIIRTSAESGQRREIPIDVGRILDGKSEDISLQSRDIVFVPDSSGRRAIYRSSEAVLSIATGVIIWRR